MEVTPERLCGAEKPANRVLLASEALRVGGLGIKELFSLGPI
jgi:hypothetical protein